MKNTWANIGGIISGEGFDLNTCTVTTSGPTTTTTTITTITPRG